MQPVSEIIDLDGRLHQNVLRDMWQGRALAAALHPGEFVLPRHVVGMCLLSVLSHNYDEHMLPLLTSVFPNFRSIGAPYLCTAAKIAKSGHVMADLVTREGRIITNQCIFVSTRRMEREFRKFADDLKFDDRDRILLFNAVQRWVVCDFRIDPNMDPTDPDAKRLVH